MWDKLNIFSWSKKKQNIVPVQREASVTLTNGDKRVTIQRSPSGNKLASSSSAQHGLDDDNSSEASTSLNFGFKQGNSSRRNSSYSFTREPLDLPTWSNVTSPGFTSRLVQQASENSPLKEFNDSLSHSPFRKSPYKEMGLGEMPFVNYSRKSSFSPSVYPAPQRTSSMRSGVSSSVYNRDRRRNARQGQTFVRIAPIDPSVKANVSISRKSSSPPVDMGSNGSPYPPRSPRAANEHYRSEGLGGIPQQELAMRFNRLWPSSPGGPVPGPGRPSSPTSPSNIMEALTAGRKRTREQDTYYPPNATPPSVSPPSKISIGIGDTPVRPQVSKRVKFLAGPESHSHDRPMMVGYPGMGSGDSEPLSSESILEQMNQTEKRFLPDSTSTPYSMQKKGIRMPSNDDQASALQSALRKRRSQGSMGAVEEEARGEKQGRFCTCNECYAEAAGISSHDQSIRKDGSVSPRDSDEKSTNTGESKSRETCDKSVSTIEFDRGAYFREVFRKADKKRTSKDDDIDDLLPYGKTVITKEMYDRDKRKRIERYYRILKLKPPEGDKFDPCPGNKSSVTTVDGGCSASANAPSTTSSSVLDVNGSTTKPGFSFGSGSPATVPASSGGFSFGKQASPAAPTIATTACPTITSPLSITGSSFGINNSGAAHTSSATTLTRTITSPSVLPPGGSISSPVSQATAGSSGGFSLASSGSNPVTENKLSTTPAPTFGLGLQTAAVTTTTSVHHTFGSPSSTSALPEANKGTGSGFSFGGGTPTAPVQSTTASGLGGNNSSTPSGGFSFGSSTSVASPVSEIKSSTTTTTAPPPYSLGLQTSSSSTTTSAVPTFGAPPSSSSTLGGNNNTSGGFSFGGSGSSQTQPTSTAGIGGNTKSVGFSFSSSSNPAAEVKSATTTSSSMPTFGAGVTSQTATTTAGITLPTFGTPTPAPSGTSNNSSGGFSFGGSGATTQPATGLGGNTGATTSSGFSFGSAVTTAATKSTSNGAPASTFTLGSQPTTTTSSNLPSFGSSFNGGSSTTSAGFSFGGSGTAAQTQPASTSVLGGNNNSNPSSGFAFGASAVSNPANEVKQATNTGAPPPAFGQASQTSAPTFGQTSQASAPTFGQASQASVPAFGQTSAPAFGQTSQTSAPTTTATVPTFGSPFSGGSNTGFGFGGSGNASTQPAGVSGNSSSTSSAGFNFGASSGTGGFSFGKVASPNATTAASSVMSTSSTTQSAGNIFGSAVTSPSASSTNAGIFGASASGSQTAFGQSAGSTFGSSGTTGSSGGFNFAAVPNPLAGNKTSATPTPAFGSSGSTAAPPPAFGSSASNSVFGGANNNSNANTGFAFGGSGAMSPPQPQTGSTSSFSFGGNAPQQNTQAPAAPSGAMPFQFGQQAAQGVQGGFNFSATAPAPSPGGTPMFSMGSTSTAPRRRDVRRRHR